MSALIVVETPGGRRSCDAKCYLAVGGECDCVCGGMNHGVGCEQAIANTAERASEMLRDAVKAGDRMKIFGRDQDQMFW